MERDNSQDKAIVKLETNYLNMAEKIDKLEQTVLKGFDDIKNEIKCFKSEADQRYAPVWVKGVLLWGGGLVGSFLTVYVLNQLFK